MLIAKFDQLISIVTKLAKDVYILKFGNGVLLVVTSPVVSTPFVATTPPLATRVPAPILDLARRPNRIRGRKPVLPY